MESNTLHLTPEKEKEGRSTTILPNKILTREPSVIEIELASSHTTPSRDPLASPDCSLNDRETSQCSSQTEIVSMTQLLFLVFKRTVAWVGGGIVIMILGIGIFQAALLPKIFTCPPGATCNDSYDPNTTMVLQLLQTAMSWWLKVGLIVSGFGLLRLSAYQSWFVMMKHGNSIDNLDLTLGAVKGSLLDACRLVLRRGNIFLSLLLLAQIGIGAAINLFVGLSIVRSPGNRVVPFSYPPISQLPDSSIAGLNSDGQNQAKAKVVGWALTNDMRHGGALRGSLVTPDGRSNASVNAQPGGPIISGSISCTPVANENITKITTNGADTYNILHNMREYLALPNMFLSVSMTLIGTARVTYLWVSNTTGMLPNATLTPDGVMYVTLCNHDVFFLDAPPQVPGVQYLEPNTAVVSGCRSQDMGVCVADSVSNTIMHWWGGIGQSFWNVACRGGVIGPLKRQAPHCALTNELWVETVTSVLDGIMQTSPARGLDVQELDASVHNIDTTWWWLQGVIPLMTLALYFLALAYTCYLSQGNSTLKSLNLEEIIGAAQTDHVKDLIQSGRLRKSTMRYDNGFTRDNAQGP